MTTISLESMSSKRKRIKYLALKEKKSQNLIPSEIMLQGWRKTKKKKKGRLFQTNKMEN
jgi:hypothetical protein